MLLLLSHLQKDEYDLQKSLLWRVKPVYRVLRSFPRFSRDSSLVAFLLKLFFSNSATVREISVRNDFSIFVDSRRFTISTIARTLPPSATVFSTLSPSFHTARAIFYEFLPFPATFCPSSSACAFSNCRLQFLPRRVSVIFRAFLRSFSSFCGESTISFFFFFFTIRRNF